MAVRELDGVDDDIVMSAGGLSGMTYGTFALLVERTGPSNEWNGLCILHDSAGDHQVGLITTGDGNDQWRIFIGGDSSNALTVTTSDWYVVVIRKETGTATPRFTTYHYSTDTWSSGNGDGTLPDWTAIGTGGDVRFGRENTADYPDIRIAARAVWSNSLPWSADTTGDAAIETAGLETAASNWLDNSPDAMWLFNQSATTEDVEDVTGGGADQTAITGTTVVIGDDPPGFDFSLTSGTPYGRVTETETARALVASKAAAFGRAVETTLARAFGLIRAYATGRAAETETVRGFTAAKSAAAGRATETETTRAFGVDLGAVIGRVTESETARSFTVAKAADFSRATEVEAARAFGVTFGHTFGRVTETEQARGFTAAKTVTFGRVVETEAARALPSNVAESVVTAQGTHSLTVTATGAYASTVAAAGTHDLIVEAEGAL